MSDSNKPLVGIVCCRKEIERHPFHVVGEKYIKAIHKFSNVTSVLIPSDDLSSMGSIINRLDGFLLTGSLSNVHPDRYSDTIKDSEMLIDPDRDEYVFSAVKQIIDMELPILAICRGFQEMNVIFGGSLYQSLENESDYKSHDFDRNAAVEVQYDISHNVSFKEGGYLHELTRRQYRDGKDHATNQLTNRLKRCLIRRLEVLKTAEARKIPLRQANPKHHTAYTDGMMEGSDPSEPSIIPSV